MFTFLFGWMGSLMFWVLYLTVALFAGTAVLRVMAPNTYRYITTGYCRGYDIPICLITLAITVYLFWYVFALGLLVVFSVKVLFGKILGTSLRQAIKFADKTIPHVDIRRERDE